VHVSIIEHLDEIAALCRRVGARRLDVFGSATGGTFKPGSDVDFVVEWDTAQEVDYFDAYFTLKEGLEDLLGRPVDLITRASIENPYFLRRVESTSEPVYAS
jgi:predicted nucleotidyltransferase